MGTLLNIKRKENALTILIIIAYISIVFLFISYTDYVVNEDEKIRKEVEIILNEIEESNWKNMPK
jgi:hypothetical protein